MLLTKSVEAGRASVKDAVVLWLITEVDFPALTEAILLKTEKLTVTQI